MTETTHTQSVNSVYYANYSMLCTGRDDVLRAPILPKLLWVHGAIIMLRAVLLVGVLVYLFHHPVSYRYQFGE